MASASNSTLTINIPGFTDVTGHTEYIVKTSVGDHQFTVMHRFSNFIEVCVCARERVDAARRRARA